MKIPIAIIAVLVVTACTTPQRPPVSGTVSGHQIIASFDGEIAERTLRAFSAGLVPQEPEIRAALADEGLPNFEHMQDLARRTSVDTAAMVLIERLSRIPEQAEMQSLYWSYLDRLRQWGRDGVQVIAACLSGGDFPEFHFVPGWFYRLNPSTGADFAVQRRLLTALGFRAVLIGVDENGSVEDNAATIARHLRDVAPERRVIVVSTSKGGPEVAHALGALLSHEESASIQAWVNVGGVLRGSPLADRARAWPLSWLAWAALAWDGIDASASLPSLTSARSEARLERQRLPGHVRVFNYVGVPMSGQVTGDARDGYERLRRSGPNDGLTPIVHQWAHGGDIVLDVGLDHFYRDAEIDLKTAALAFTVLENLGEESARACIGPRATFSPPPAP